MDISCNEFCGLANLTCIDSFQSLTNQCDDKSLTLLCEADQTEAHSCVCWDANGDYVTYWDIQPRDFLPMLIFVLAFPFVFFTISGFMYWKAESLEDQLEAANEAPKDKNQGPRGSMSDGMKNFR